VAKKPFMSRVGEVVYHRWVSLAEY
jgi:hypothetical protein